MLLHGMYVIKEDEMRAFILSAYFYVGILTCSNVQAALAAHHEATSCDSLSKTCLRVDSEEDAKFAERNIASFFHRNKETILALKKMGALDENSPLDLDYSKVKELLLKVWSSETTIAVCFKTMPKRSTADLINLQDQVWLDSYQLHSEEVKNIGQLRNMLNLLSALIDISHKVF